VRHVRDLIDQKLFRHNRRSSLFSFSARSDGFIGTRIEDASSFFYPFKSLEFCSRLLSFWATGPFASRYRWLIPKAATREALQGAVEFGGVRAAADMDEKC
jgi:hypothetical protein